MPIKPAWPSVIYTKTKGTGPKTKRRLVINQIENEKAAAARRGAAAEIIAESKREIAKARQAREERQRVRDAMMAHPDSELKLIRKKDGSLTLRRRENNKFQPSIPI